MAIFIGSIGFFLILWSCILLVKMIWPGPSFIFDFEDSTCELDIESPGYYSIGLLGAGYVDGIKRVNIKIQYDGGLLEVKSYEIMPRVPKRMKMAVGCWYFAAERLGNYTLTLSNLLEVEAKRSMLMSKRAFEDPLDKRDLSIIVYKSVRPLYQFLAILAAILGSYLVLIFFVPNF